MHNKLNIVLSSLVIVSLACSLSGTGSQQGPSATSGSSEIEVTDSNGHAQLTEPGSGQVQSYEIIDSSSRVALSGVKIAIQVEGGESLLLIYDPTNQYVPLVLDNEALADLRASKLASPDSQLETIVLALTLYTAIETVDDFIALFKHPPRLENASFGGTDYCWNGDQMAQEVSVGLLAGGFFGLPGFSTIGEAFKADQATLDMLKISQFGAENDLDQRIRSFNGILRFHYGLTILGIPILWPKGYCLDPLDRSNLDSVMNWLSYSLQTHDTFPISKLLDRDLFGYANYLEGGQNVTPDQFLQHLETRIGSNVSCQGYYLDQYSLQVWTKGWTPAWEMTESCYIDCQTYNPPYQSADAGFFFQPSNGLWSLNLLYQNTPENYYFMDQPLAACDSAISATQGGLQSVETPGSASCSGAPPQRLHVGGTATVCTQSDRVILRSGPARSYDALKRYEPGTELEVIGGPACANDWSWWQVVAPDGAIGWMTEGGDNDDPYYLCP